MRGWLAFFLIGAVFAASPRRCRPRYLETKQAPEAFARQPRRCPTTTSQIGEEYWSTVAPDGVLRGGRTVNDFLVIPHDKNDGQHYNQSYIGFWITRTRYGPNEHYEAFGHVFIKEEAGQQKICGWFVGLNKEVVQLCSGFRILSRSSRNPNEEIPFEWAQGANLRDRDTVGFHHHRIAKYEGAGDNHQIVYGDAHVSNKRFKGVSPDVPRLTTVDNAPEFDSRVWLLKRKPQFIKTTVPKVVQQPLSPLMLYADPQTKPEPIDFGGYPYQYQYNQPQYQPSYQSYYADRNRYPNQNVQQSSEVSGEANGRPRDGFDPYANVDLRPNSGYSVGNDLRRGQDGFEEQRRQPQQAPALTKKKGGESEGSGDKIVIPYNNRNGYAVGSGVEAQREDDSYQYQDPVRQKMILDRQREEELQKERYREALRKHYEQQRIWLEKQQQPDRLASGQRSSQPVVGGVGQQNQYQPSGQQKDGRQVLESPGASSPAERDSLSQDTAASTFDVLRRGQGQDEASAPAVQQPPSVNYNVDPSRGTVHLAKVRPKTLVRDKKGNLYEQIIENGRTYYYEYIDPSSNTVQRGHDVKITGIDPNIESAMERERVNEEQLRRIIAAQRRAGNGQARPGQRGRVRPPNPSIGPFGSTRRHGRKRVRTQRSSTETPATTTGTD
ncbi:unnamed protein product [Caenorhabditis auriculariae]|uniref:Uncharacterized protein n=1 Tax=Caenorhabditis auriculariae TaxID=2777116 RepID=A0A8S1GPN4_9PELO|nr:unnamed protein product [Caenorhabditis auriculariae]